MLHPSPLRTVEESLDPRPYRSPSRGPTDPGHSAFVGNEPPYTLKHTAPDTDNHQAPMGKGPATGRELDWGKWVQHLVEN